MREKRQLENRVKHLEQTSQNWNMLVKTRDHFHRRANNNRSSQERKKATLDGEFNDDFEPVRPQMDGADIHTNMNSDLPFEESSSGAPQSRGTNGHQSSQPIINNRQTTQSSGPVH